MNAEYYLWIGGGKSGPYSVEEIRRLLEVGKITRDTAFSPTDSDRWAPLGEIMRLVYREAPSVPIQPAIESQEINRQVYFLVMDDKEQGPFTLGQIRSMWQAGRITIQTLYCPSGLRGWKPLSEMLSAIELPTSQPTTYSGTESGPLVVKATKSRGVYIILGLFLGCLGLHNFYAGYHGRGAAQLIITLLLGWICIGLIITVIWSLLDICTVTQDASGDPFS